MRKLIDGGTVSKPWLPADFGHLNKRDYPKIDIYVDGVYKASTTWARTQLIARASYADVNRIDLYRVKAVKRE